MYLRALVALPSSVLVDAFEDRLHGLRELVQREDGVPHGRRRRVARKAI